MKIPCEFLEEEVEDQEFQGPWDGVLPATHPQAYGELSELYCMTINRDTACIYVRTGRRVCVPCYAKLPPVVQQTYQPGGWHNLCNHDATLPIANCILCNENFVVVRPAQECTECIETYFEMSTSEEWAVQTGRVIDVITRW